MKALGLDFFKQHGKQVPLAGAQRTPAPLVATRRTFPHPERLPDGRYEVTIWMEDRCCNLVEVGAWIVYVPDDYGDFVAVEDRGRAWR